jgi:hypothetical protein
MGPTALLSLKRKSYFGSVSPLKFDCPRPGVNPRTMILMASTITTRLPRPTRRAEEWCSELSSVLYCRLKWLTTDDPLMMEAVRTSETSVDNHFTRQYNPGDSSEHHTRRRENLKSHMSRRMSGRDKYFRIVRYLDRRHLTWQEMWRLDRLARCLMEISLAWSRKWSMIGMRLQSTDRELIPARNESLTAMKVYASGSNVCYYPT